MAQEQHVAKLDRPAPVILGQCRLVELWKRHSQAFLDLPGERHTPVLPVDSDELGEIVSPLDDAGERLGNQPTVGLVARHLANKQQRSVAQFHVLARLDRQGRYLLRSDLEVRVQQCSPRSRLRPRRTAPPTAASVGAVAPVKCA